MMLLQTHALTSGYGALVAVNGADICVKEGETTALLGLNGAGKSSLLNAIMGSLPARGKIEFDGEDISHLTIQQRISRGIALCPEGRHVFSRMTVLENIRMGGYTLGKAQCERSMERIFELFPKLRERIRQPAGTLSGGEQQWLAIGRALMCSPRLLMLDEPCLGLAPAASDELFDQLAALVKHGTSLLIVEQNVQGVLRLASDVYRMEQGMCSYMGEARALAQDKRFTMEWLGLN